MKISMKRRTSQLQKEIINIIFNEENKKINPKLLWDKLSEFYWNKNSKVLSASLSRSLKILKERKIIDFNYNKNFSGKEDSKFKKEIIKLKLSVNPIDR